MDKHWTERLFIDSAQLYGPMLEERVQQAKDTTPGLVSIFSDFNVLPGALVLDLACGIGRYSVALAEKGYTVVGVDLSVAFINRAKEMAAERGVAERCDFRVGDMRQIGKVLRSQKEKFKVVLILFTSIGYYNEETDRQVLKQLLGLRLQKAS
jgi:2-polyprenyl-3-methyl-5-hydroxy-6-metoxy-1,4-benzoquinol methylase